MKFAKTALTVAVGLVLAANVLQAEPPEPAPAKDADPAPARLPAQVTQEPPAAPKPNPFERHYRQTIDWLPRPRSAADPAPPARKSPPGDVVQAQAEVPPVPPPPAPPLSPAGQVFYELSPGTLFSFAGLVRGYRRMDQRIYWSGLENTFGGEAVLRPTVQTDAGRWTITGQAEFFINQKYGSSILSDPQRDLYRTNFQIDPFEVFQLFGQVQYGDWTLRMGKTRTPFGGYAAPMFTNSLIDAPFLRTEVIPWTETGMFLHYQPGLLTADLGIANGEPNLDTNSSKAGIARLGLTGDTWTLGASVKWHDGISSEYHKRYNNIVGVDWSLRTGRVVWYGEATYDQYGFHRLFDGQGNPLNLGVRSLYRRDIFKFPGKNPVHGTGYYVGASYFGDRWVLDGNYGTYFPERLGVAPHDTITHRGVVKLAYLVTPNFQLYGVGLVENNRPPDGVLRNDQQFAIIGGMQLGF